MRTKMEDHRIPEEPDISMTDGSSGEEGKIEDQLIPKEEATSARSTGEE